MTTREEEETKRKAKRMHGLAEMMASRFLTGLSGKPPLAPDGSRWESCCEMTSVHGVATAMILNEFFFISIGLIKTEMRMRKIPESEINACLDEHVKEELRVLNSVWDMSNRISSRVPVDPPVAITPGKNPRKIVPKVIEFDEDEKA